MKYILLSIFLIPLLGSSQGRWWSAAGGSVYMDRTFSKTGYGADINTNFFIVPDFYLGLGTGVSRIPILSNAYIPVTGRATFFTTLNQSSLLPFASVDVGYGIYKDGNGRKGNALGFGVVGFFLKTKKMPPPYISFGYGVYGYTLSTGDPATQRRAVLKIGMMLQKLED